MANVIQPGVPTVGTGWTPAPYASSRLIPGNGIDMGLLVCALFLDRFTLTFGHSLMSLAIVPAALILIQQFFSGRLVVIYNRLLWFLAAWLAITGSLLLNFQSTMLPSFLELTAVYFLFTLSRPSTPEAYKGTLRAFQFLAAVLSFLAVAQFAAQFVVDGREIVRFYGVFPKFLFTDRENTIIPVAAGSHLIKSNGIFLEEPSALSQIAALGILIEVLEFHRLRYILLLALGLLLSYSGTGLMLLLVFLPVASIVYRSARLTALLLIIFAFALIASGSIDLSAFTSRVGEFENTRASGFQRFVSPFWLAKDHFDTASTPALLIGVGPGTMDAFATSVWYTGFAGTWIKLVYEYGFIGSTVFMFFLASCLRKSMCSGLLLAAILFSYVFLGGQLLGTGFLTIMLVLCTLNAPEIQRGRDGGVSRYRPCVVTASGGG